MENKQLIMKEYLDFFDNIPIYPELKEEIDDILNFNSDYYLEFNSLINNNPLLTLTLLKSSNNPLFEKNEDIYNISQAIKIFNIESIRGFALEYIVKNDKFNFHLEDIYNMNMAELISTSNKRRVFTKELVKKLFNNKEIKNRTYLETISFISSIGILFLAQIFYYHNNNDLKEEFNEDLEMLDGSLEDLEKEYLGFDNYDFLAFLLKKWNFSEKYVLIIENLNNKDIDKTNFLELKENINLILLTINLINVDGSITDLKDEQIIKHLDFLSIDDSIIEETLELIDSKY